jgi:hypothetical protein
MLPDETEAYLVEPNAVGCSLAPIKCAWNRSSLFGISNSGSGGSEEKTEKQSGSLRQTISKDTLQRRSAIVEPDCHLKVVRQRLNDANQRQSMRCDHGDVGGTKLIRGDDRAPRAACFRVKSVP